MPVIACISLRNEPKNRLVGTQLGSNCGLRWVRFPKRTHRKIASSKVSNLWQNDGYVENGTGKRWVRFAKTMVCKLPILHKACRVVALAKTEGLFLT